MRLGILGGAFDPIHLGHLAAAHAAIDCAELDRVLFMPSSQPPHRSPAIAPAADRLEMSKLAIEGEPSFATSDLELRREGPSYTLDTLRELTRGHVGDDLYLVLGWDAARLFHTWHEPERVQELAVIVVVSRPGTSETDPILLRSAGLDPSRVIICTRPTPDVSSSELRRAVAAGASIAGQVPPAVEVYIAAHGLYRDNR